MIRMIAVIHAVVDLGYSVALDDFGTGSSSLGILTEIPFHYLKIDRSFVANLETVQGYKIFSCICAMADSLNKDIIAEGIETKEQLKMVSDLGIRLVQGYLFAKPQPSISDEWRSS